jgi:hypothetical protein
MWGQAEARVLRARVLTRCFCWCFALSFSDCVLGSGSEEKKRVRFLSETLALYKDLEVKVGGVLLPFHCDKRES